MFYLYLGAASIPKVLALSYDPQEKNLTSPLYNEKTHSLKLY